MKGRIAFREVGELISVHRSAYIHQNQLHYQYPGYPPEEGTDLLSTKLRHGRQIYVKRET